LNLNWVNNQTNVNWEELTELYRIAPLGIKYPDKLKVTFTNSMFKCFYMMVVTL